jgi:hypothetical protein
MGRRPGGDWLHRLKGQFAQRRERVEDRVQAVGHFLEVVRMSPKAEGGGQRLHMIGGEVGHVAFIADTGGGRQAACGLARQLRYPYEP